MKLLTETNDQILNGMRCRGADIILLFLHGITMLNLRSSGKRDKSTEIYEKFDHFGKHV